jgi:DNA-binding LacI/PurR family transcriptional regulator
MVRLKEIAELARVSVMTVSKALRDAHDVSAETKTRVKLIAQQLGYVPDSTAQGLRTRKTKLFGLIIPSSADPVFSRLVLGVEEAAYEAGYDLLLAHTMNIPEREEACIRRFLSRRVDGLLIAPVYRMAEEARIYEELFAREVPTLLLGHRAAFCSRFKAIATDDLQSSTTATRHLLELGHRRIAFLAGPPGTPWAQERFEGYRHALREAGLEVDDRLVFQAGRTIEDGAAAATQILNEGLDATAIQAVSDSAAIGCARTLMNQGIRIPEDCSLVGFGNYPLSEHFCVPLTTLRQPKYRLGTAAVYAMRQLLRGETPETKPLPAELVIRSSSGTPPAHPMMKPAKTEKS